MTYTWLFWLVCTFGGALLALGIESLYDKFNKNRMEKRLAKVEFERRLKEVIEDAG